MDTPSPWALPPQCVPEPIKFSNIIKLEKSKKEREKKQIVEDFNFAMALSASEPPSQTAPTVETDEDGACSSKSVINSLSIPNVVESKTDDSVIAQLLQAEFDLEFDEEIKRLEQSRNKNSKVTVSLANYRLYPDELLQNDSDKEDEDLVDARRSKNWDRFEKNQKEISKIGKSGYRADAHGNVLTKHDEVLIGRKNAGKIMEQLNYGIPSGDCGNFDMKVSNKVFNELRAHSNMIAKKTNQTALDRRENIKTAEMGMDEKTRLILYKLINQGILDVVDGVVSTGKEAVILHADTQQGNEDYPDLPKEVAIKIFSTTLNEFKQRDRYIRDDYRFKDNMKSGRNLISKWCEKEFHNLSRLKKAEIPCPDVVLMKKHILVMSYIGSGHTSPAPKLKDVQFTSQEELVGAYQEVIDIMKRMYRQARLVHADFSEYNILWHEGHCVIIDMAQSVEPIHPSALEFLMRDCGNITSFFEKRGVPPNILLSKEQLFFDITQLDPLTTNTTMLERIHMKGEPEHIINRPQNIDGNNESEKVPEKYRLSQFPFDYAWKKVEELKEKSKAESLSDEPPKETEWAEVKSKKRNKRKSESKTIIDNDIADGLKLISMTSN